MRNILTIVLILFFSGVSLQMHRNTKCKRVVIFTILPNVNNDLYKDRVFTYSAFVIENNIYRGDFIENDNAICNLKDSLSKGLFLQRDKSVSKFKKLYDTLNYHRFKTSNDFLNNSYYYKCVSVNMEYSIIDCFDDKEYVQMLKNMYTKDKSIYPLRFDIETLQEEKIPQSIVDSLIKYVGR